MNHPKRIAIIDSGIGGLALLAKIAHFPVNYLYIADNAFMPYGNKTYSQLIERAKDLAHHAFSAFEADCLVIACNTLTACALNTLRRLYPDKVIMGCEPPIKQCVQYSASKVLLVCTQYTAQYYQSLQIPNVKICPLPQLADMVEHQASNKKIQDYIEHNVDVTDCDCIALGCTHYSHIKHCFEQLYPAMKVFDSIDGTIARMRKTVLKRSYCKNATNTLQWMFTATDANILDKYKQILHALT